MDNLKRYTGKQMHDDAKHVYRDAIRRPVVIEHKHHGELVLMSSDHYLALVNREHAKHIGVKKYEEIQCDEKL